MQPDIERDVQIASTLHKVKYEDLSLAQEYPVQAIQLSAESSERISQESSTGGQQQVRQWRPSPALWSLTLMIGDSVLILASLASLLILAPHFDLTFHISWNEPGTWNLKLIWGCIALLSWSIAVNITQAQDLRNASNRFKSPLRALFALMLMVIFWIVLIYPFIADRLSPSIILLLLFLVVAAPSLSAWRVALAECMHLPRFRTRAVIIGSTVAGETIAREFQMSRRPDISLLGYVSENVQKEGLPVLGGRNTLQDLMRNDMIDMIIMATDYKAEPALFQEAIEATQLGISLIPMPVAYESIGGKIPVEHVGDQWYLALPVEIIASPLYLCWRKVMDLIFGLLGTLSLLLILPALALLIILDSRGPVFYRQERLGRNGRKFFIYKFRSMYIDAEHAGRAIWTTRGDLRITRIGHFLRVTHLDELPQVFNILRGDMSLIGPRPEREAFVTELEKTIPFYRCRLIVKPGLTGWAQVKYHYGGTNEGTLAKLQYDLYYIKHQSFTLDIWIILKTVAEVLFCRGT
ncbi:MAG TPA: exopolysaccharide biosynthesis polyprenyl glycosylphosphotransferase [Ktedonobacteraceae bacterium]|nr:exopolysaccharide biosynthesis polyprenyl glycosylphosphotransferase [Ktedonobacteraceae bacterium]